MTGKRPRKRYGARSGLLLLLLLVLAPSCAQWARTASHRQFTVRTNGEVERVREMAERVEFIIEVYSELFGVDPADLGHLEILDNVPAGEVRVGMAEPGRYEGAHHRIVLNDTADDELLLHEIAHHFVRGIREPLPPWVNEGLAVYLAWSGVESEGLVLGGLPVHHVRDTVIRAREDKLIPLSRLTDLTPSEFYHSDEGERIRNYSQSWSLVYFLLEEALPQEDMPRRIRQLLRLSTDEVLALEGRYRRYWRLFDIRAELEEQIRSGEDSRRHLAAILTGIVGDETSLGVLQHIAVNESEKLPTRLAALNAIGTILYKIDDGNGEIERRLEPVLLGLGQSDSHAIRDLSLSLAVAVRQWDRNAFSVFALALTDDPVYPSRSFSRSWK